MQYLDAITNSKIWSRHGVQVAWVFAVLCLLLVVLSIGLNIYQSGEAKAAHYQPQKLPPITRSKAPQYRISDAINANLFGDPTPKPVVKQAPKTTLDLTLEGVLWATDAEMGRAIITSGRKKAKLYSIGERIQGAGAAIEEIRDTEVILNRNGALESLPLKKSTGGDSIITYVDDPTGSSGQLSQASYQATPLNQTPSITRSSGSNQVREGKARKIKKPNFSGLDRALQKMGEI